MGCLRDTHRGRYLHDEMEVVGHHRHLNDPDTMAVSYLAKNGLTKIFMFLPVKHLVPVFGTPLQMVHTLANAMASAMQLHFFTYWTGTIAPVPAGAPIQLLNE